MSVKFSDKKVILRYSFHFIITLITFFVGCVNPNQQNLKEMKNEVVIKEVENKKKSSIIVREINELHITLSFISKNVSDSLVINLKVTNNSKRDVFIYSPLISGSELNDNVFFIRNINDSNYNLLPFLGTESNNYYQDGKMPFPIVIPSISENKIIKLKSGLKLNFRINLSKFYKFKKTNLKQDVYQIEYLAYMPLIENLQHLFELDSDSINKPVYYILSSKNNLKTSKLKTP